MLVIVAVLIGAWWSGGFARVLPVWGIVTHRGFPSTVDIVSPNADLGALLAIALLDLMSRWLFRKLAGWKVRPTYRLTPITGFRVAINVLTALQLLTLSAVAAAVWPSAVHSAQVWWVATGCLAAVAVVSTLLLCCLVLLSDTMAEMHGKKPVPEAHTVPWAPSACATRLLVRTILIVQWGLASAIGYEVVLSVLEFELLAQAPSNDVPEDASMAQRDDADTKI